ncbi:MAG: hypothetical protein ACFCUN_09210 [Hyphomicrobiaceae bacterium]
MSLRYRPRSIWRGFARSGLSALLLLSAPIAAPASVIINADSTTYELAIIEDGDVRSRRTIGSGVRMEDVCPSGCVLRLEGIEDATYLLEGGEQVTIESGLVYFDGLIGELSARARQRPAPFR